MRLNPLIVDARCEATVDMAGEPTIGTWYQIWEAMVALASICMRGKDRGGKATGLGQYFQNIELHIRGY